MTLHPLVKTGCVQYHSSTPCLWSSIRLAFQFFLIRPNFQTTPVLTTDPIPSPSRDLRCDAPPDSIFKLQKGRNQVNGIEKGKRLGEQVWGISTCMVQDQKIKMCKTILTTSNIILSLRNLYIIEKFTLLWITYAYLNFYLNMGYIILI
jgi:hypothetical protein